MDSPPKRMTRARAAAKANESSTVKTTRVVTAAARAKAAGSTATKRKTRADENDEDSSESDARARRLRGRPSRAAVPTTDDDDRNVAPSLSSAPVSRATRTTTRAARMTTTQPRKKGAAMCTAARGRPRRNTATLAATATAATTTAVASARSSRAAAGKAGRAAPPAVKKSVKFDETDKENISPAAAKTDESDATSHRGMRAAPARHRPPTPARKTARTAAAAPEKKPLSPRKVTQIPVLRRDGNDVISADGSPHRNGPAEQLINVTPVKRSVEQAVFDKDLDSTMTVNAAILNAPESTTATFGSPPRRPPTSPSRDTFKSPAKRMGGAISFPGSSMKPVPFSQDNDARISSSVKNTLFQTPAKRPPSPIKGMAFPSVHRPHTTQETFRASLFQSPAKRAAPFSLKSVSERPAAAAICETPAMKPIATSTSVVRFDTCRPLKKLTLEEESNESLPDALEAETLENPKMANRFNGRLSDVVPRVDVANELEEEQEEDEVNLVHTYSFYEQAGDGAVAPRQGVTPTSSVESLEVSKTTEAVVLGFTPNPAVTPQDSRFQLREKDLDPCHDMDESDEELGVDEDESTFTPSFSKNRRSTMGLTNLAHVLGTWSSDGPTMASDVMQPGSGLPRACTVVPVAESSPMKTSFFEDQMQTEEENKQEQTDKSGDDELSDPSFDEDIIVTTEDLALAEEAEEMSHLHESPCAERSVAKSFSDSLSEGNQEYGDENALPVDPALGNQPMRLPCTPARPVPRSCSTTTKVPLKPADESSPTKSRRFSACRIPNNGTGSLPKSATAISYSPEMRRSSDVFNMDQEPSTPVSKFDMWTNMDTPARTSRNDGDRPLLRGAVVFVDVHTSEGADASLIFVDLLTQMGAKCVKTWSWNPDAAAAPSSSHSESSSNRIGITHVVFKDGGKRTMEKVRKSNGVVQCVGVSWVLDCEKENEWLDEAPYLIDTSFVPRGGARRRKSMEPKALSNKNGTLVSTPANKQGSGSYNRRQSGIWVQTPPDQAAGGEQQENGDDIEWSEFILTPVPKTPGPETISKFAMEEPETPSKGEDTIRTSLSVEDLLMRTCPPKANGSGVCDGMGEGLLSSQEDNKVLMRLMAARRKSLQFAPKIASPLSKSWY